jgi:hypothetical protein
VYTGGAPWDWGARAAGRANGTAAVMLMLMASDSYCHLISIEKTVQTLISNKRLDKV